MSAFRRPLQMCYTIDIMTNETLISQCKEPWLLELRVGSYIKRKQTILFLKNEVIPVIAVESQTSPLAEMANLDLRFVRKLYIECTLIHSIYFLLL